MKNVFMFLPVGAGKTIADDGVPEPQNVADTEQRRAINETRQFCVRDVKPCDENHVLRMLETCGFKVIKAPESVGGLDKPFDIEELWPSRPTTNLFFDIYSDRLKVDKTTELRAMARKRNSLDLHANAGAYCGLYKNATFGKFTDPYKGKSPEEVVDEIHKAVSAVQKAQEAAYRSYLTEAAKEYITEDMYPEGSDIEAIREQLVNSLVRSYLHKESQSGNPLAGHSYAARREAFLDRNPLLSEMRIQTSHLNPIKDFILQNELRDASPWEIMHFVVAKDRKKEDMQSKKFQHIVDGPLTTKIEIEGIHPSVASSKKVALEKIEKSFPDLCKRLSIETEDAFPVFIQKDRNFAKVLNDLGYYQIVGALGGNPMDASEATWRDNIIQEAFHKSITEILKEQEDVKDKDNNNA